jgi:excisionase family DNA binding protein
MAVFLREGLMGRELVRPRELAKEVGVSRSTIYRWFLDGRFGGVRLGGIVRIFRDDFERYVEGGIVEKEEESVRKARGERRGRPFLVYYHQEGMVDPTVFTEVCGPD